MTDNRIALKIRLFLAVDRINPALEAKNPDHDGRGLC
jgi:hypothetical protein